MIQNRLKAVGNVVVRVESVRSAIVQGVFSRADRRVAQQILDAGHPGVGLSAILRRSPEFLDHYVYRERGRDEIFPWEVTDHGLSRRVLHRSYTRSQSSR